MRTLLFSYLTNITTQHEFNKLVTNYSAHQVIQRVKDAGAALHDIKRIANLDEVVVKEICNVDAHAVLQKKKLLKDQVALQHAIKQLQIVTGKFVRIIFRIWTHDLQVKMGTPKCL